MIIKLVHKFQWENTNIYYAGYHHSKFCKSPWSLNQSLYNLITCVKQAYQSYVTMKPKLFVCHYKNRSYVASYACISKLYLLSYKGFNRPKKCNTTMWYLRSSQQCAVIPCRQVCNSDVLKYLGLPDTYTNATQSFEMPVTTHLTKQCHITQALNFSCNNAFCGVW
jgi:hypothetical protein